MSEAPKPSEKSLWELLWDYDPNGLLVVDAALTVRVVNPAFCRMFETSPEEVVGKPASSVVDDVEDFQEVWGTDRVILGKEKEYPQHGLYVRKVVFAIEAEGVAACIMVDLTRQRRQMEELLKLRRETIAKANEVVDHQMRVAQEIAGLLGEATAEAKVSLLRLVEAFDQETV